MPTPDSLEPTAEPRDRPGETPTPGSSQHNPYAGWIVTPLIVIALIVLALWIPYELEKSERQRQLPRPEPSRRRRLRPRGLLDE